MIIAKVRKQGVQKIVCVPKNSDINLGDYVNIEKVEFSDDDNGEKNGEQIISN